MVIGEPFQLWEFSHDGGRRYGIMTTNMSEVFNGVLKGARSLPFTALVQLTFFLLNSYCVARREQGANRLASDELFTPYVDAQIQGRVVKAGSMGSHTRPISCQVKEWSNAMP